MKRSVLVLFLLFASLTLAPRTATEPAPVDGLKAEISRPAGRLSPQAALPLHVTLTDLEGGAEGVLVITSSMDEGRVRVVTASGACEISDAEVRCPYAFQDPGSVRFKVTLRPLSAGELGIMVSTGEGVQLSGDSIRVLRGRR